MKRSLKLVAALSRAGSARKRVHTAGAAVVRSHFHTAGAALELAPPAASEAAGAMPDLTGPQEAAISASAASAWKGVRRFYARATVERAPGGPVLHGGVPAPALPGAEWHAVLLDGRALRTPMLNDLLVPSRALALAIAAEFAAQGEQVLPSTTPLYSLASAALDNYVHEDLAAAEDLEAEARATALAAFDSALGGVSGAGGSDAATDAFIAAGQAATGVKAAPTAGAVPGAGLTPAVSTAGTPKLREQLREYLETDSVAYRVDNGDGADPSEQLLRRRQDRYYDPLLEWWAAVTGTRLAVAVGFGEAEHLPAAYDVAEDAVDTAPAWSKAALQSLVTSTKSTILTLALVHRQVDVPLAWDTARLEEEWQIGEHGFVEDGHDTARAQLRSALATASAYLWMLPPAARPAPLPALGSRGLEAAVAKAAGERTARVAARRAREAALVAQKRAAMRAFRARGAADLVASMAAGGSGRGDASR